MPYAHSNNGNSWRCVADETWCVAGEIYFPEFPTDAELLAAFPAYVAPNAAWEAYQATARAALARSDITVHRIVEGVIAGTTAWGAPDVAPWSAYRRALRAIISAAAGDPTEAFPSAPAFPAGT
jgi:hypothetical protein